jgi:hypothetical protein
MLYCYYKIAKVVWARASAHQHSSDGNYEELKVSPRVSVQANLVSASKQKVIKMTLTVIIGFLVCLTPYFIISFLRIYSDYKLKLDYALSISEIVFMVHSALNPVLYGIFALRWKHIKKFHFRFKYHKSIQGEIVKEQETDKRRLYKLRFGMRILKGREFNHENSFIITNHTVSEDGETRMQTVRHSIKQNSSTPEHQLVKNQIEKVSSTNSLVLSTKTSMNRRFESDYGTPL